MSDLYVGTPAKKTEPAPRIKKAHKKSLVPRNQAGGQVRTLGLEPRTYGLKVRCSTN